MALVAYWAAGSGSDEDALGIRVVERADLGSSTSWITIRDDAMGNHDQQCSSRPGTYQAKRKNGAVSRSKVAAPAR